MDSFSSVIDERNNKNESVEFNFIGIEKSEIVHKDLKKNPMEVSVRFISEMITCIKNSKDEVICEVYLKVFSLCGLVHRYDN